MGRLQNAHARGHLTGSARKLLVTSLLPSIKFEFYLLNNKLICELLISW